MIYATDNEVIQIVTEIAVSNLLSLISDQQARHCRLYPYNDIFAAFNSRHVRLQLLGVPTHKTGGRVVQGYGVLRTRRQRRGEFNGVTTLRRIR